MKTKICYETHRRCNGSTCDLSQLTKIKTLRSYQAHARFLSECGDGFGVIARQIPTPYSSGPTHNVMEWQGQRIIVCETAHRKYEVFRVTGNIFNTEDDFLAAQRHERIPADHYLGGMCV